MGKRTNRAQRRRVGVAILACQRKVACGKRTRVCLLCWAHQSRSTFNIIPHGYKYGGCHVCYILPYNTISSCRQRISRLKSALHLLPAACSPVQLLASTFRYLGGIDRTLPKCKVFPNLPLSANFKSGFFFVVFFQRNAETLPSQQAASCLVGAMTVSDF